MTTQIAFNFLALPLEQRKIAFQKAAFFFSQVSKDGDTTRAVAEFRAKYMTEEPAKKESKPKPKVEPMVKKEPIVTQSVPLSQPSASDSLKNILKNMRNFEIETVDNKDAVFEVRNASGELDFRVSRLLQLMKDVSSVYDAFFRNNITLREKSEALKIDSTDGGIKKALGLVNGDLIAAPNVRASLGDTIVLTGLFTVEAFTAIAMNYMTFTWHMLQIAYGRKKLTFPSEAKTWKENWTKNSNGINFSQVLAVVLLKANELAPSASTKASIDQIKDQLEMVETLEDFFDSQSKTFKTANVYSQLLAPLNTLYHQYKTDIDNPTANDALQRLTNFGIFQRFPDNVAMQTKYLHSMSIVANMLKSHLLEGDVDHHDIERARTEWPFETTPGAAMEI